MSIFKRIVNSYSTKLTLIIVFTVFCLYFFHSYVCATFQQKNLENTILLTTDQTAKFIEKSLHVFMIENDRQNLFRALEILSRERDIERIDLLNQKGEIVFTSLRGGKTASSQNICIKCHSNKTWKIVSQHDHISFIRPSLDKKGRIVQVTNPIESSSSCYLSGCHEGNKIGECLGVLSITVNLWKVDAKFDAIKTRVRLLFLFLLVTSTPIFLLIIYYTTYKPLKKLEKGIKKIATGDLNHKIEIDRKDEFGMLAFSFNNMIDKLKKAYDEIHEWSRTLELKVDEKSKELEEMHKNLLKVEKLASLGKLSATVAHELNNPLSGIVTYSKLLSRNFQKQEFQVEQKNKMISQLNIITREALRCGNIVKNLLIFARDTSYSPEFMDLEQLIQEMFTMMEHQLYLNKINFHYHIDNSIVKIYADYEQLKQALLALIINAMEAMPDGGELNIQIWQKDSQCKIKITDTGTGIPEEISANIFDPFFSTKNKTQGVGLGLSVVYGIIKKHEGSIQVESQLNKGTTFIITLPINPKEQ